MTLERDHTVFVCHRTMAWGVVAEFMSGFTGRSFVLNRESCEDRAANIEAQGLPSEETRRALASWPEGNGE